MAEKKSSDPSLAEALADGIVISGISGRYPDSDNIDELASNLYSGVDMITEDDRRWTPGLYGLPKRAGKIRDLSKFDSHFFGVHGKQANMMDPQARLLLETTYEALVDAGLNPTELRGSKTGVFVGASVSEVEEGLAQDVSKVSGYALTGCSRSMFANRISYVFDFRGPSYAMDTACSSSCLAFQQAFVCIKSGQCDMAVVGGVSVCLRPITALQFHKLGMLSVDGRVKYLDAKANGYVRSETASVCILQRSADAKRIYASVVRAKTNTDGYKSEGVTYPSWFAQRDLLREAYSNDNERDVKIDLNELIYLEAHGTGTKVGDPQECRAVQDVICSNISKPLLVGSVKTNLGHSETSSGMCSIAKVVIALQRKCVPANLNFDTPNTDIDALVKGQIIPCTTNTVLPDNGLIGLNSFGFGGVNVHIIFRAFNRIRDETENRNIVCEGGIPRLIMFAGRTQDACDFVIDWIRKNPSKVTRDFLALLHSVYQSEIPGLGYRAYMVVKEPLKEPSVPAIAEVEPKSDESSPAAESGKVEPDEDKGVVTNVTRCGERRPLWYVFSGMGSQWPAMARGMMALPLFADSIKKSAEMLDPFGIKLMDILTSDDPKLLDTTVAPFVAIAAVQIALVDVLRFLGIEPDGIVGHSVGELGCAYADTCFDHKQMLLSAYWRGKCVEDAKLPRGLMAAVGLKWEEAQRLCPEGVVPACHNSEDSVTISGSYAATKKFVEQLSAENVFAREVKSSGVSFHSYFMNPIGPQLLEKLRAIVPHAKLRSEKWICSSIPESRWNEDLAKYAAPEYFVNNLVSPVLFKEAFEKVPNNANLVEIAPHCLLQAILKRSMTKEAVYVPLMKRNNNSNNLELFFSAIGSLYQLGYAPQVEKLYPKIEFPVSRGTQSLSSLVRWDHSQSWLVTQYPEYFNPSSNADFTVKVDINETEDEHLADHVIDGRILFPATGYLLLAWKMLAKCKGQFYDKLPVLFENVTLHRATILSRESSAKFVVRLMETSGDFSVSEAGNVIVSGKIFAISSDDNNSNVLKFQHLLPSTKIELSQTEKEEQLVLNAEEVYKELRVRGFDYGVNFKGLTEVSMSKQCGKIAYNGKWVCFADQMLQLAIVSARTPRAFYLPVRFQSVRCDPLAWRAACEESQQVNAMFESNVNLIVAPGLEIRGLKCALAPRNVYANQRPVLESYEFIGNERIGNALDEQTAASIRIYESLCARALVELFGEKETGAAIVKLAGKSSFEACQKIADQLSSESALSSSSASPPALIKILVDARTVSVEKKVAASDALSSVLSSVPGGAEAVLSSDKLIVGYQESEQLLRPLIDLTAENLHSNKLKILELSASKALLAGHVSGYLAASSLGNPRAIDFTVGHPKPSELAGISNELGVNLAEWNLDTCKMPSQVNNCDLIVYSDVDSLSVSKAGDKQVDSKALITSLYDSLKPSGFALILSRQNASIVEQFVVKKVNLKVATGASQKLLAEASKLGLSVVCKSLDLIESQNLSAILLRKAPKTSTAIDVSKQTIIEVKNSDFSWLESVKLALAKSTNKEEGENIWLTANSSDEPHSGLVGLVNCLKFETNGTRIRSILYGGQSKLSRSQLAELVKLDLVSNVVAIKPNSNNKDTIVGTYRHLTIFTDNNNNNELTDSQQQQIDEGSTITSEAYLNVTTRGDLSSLRWFESPNKYFELQTSDERQGKRRCAVYYAPLNFRDVMLASGKLPADALPGKLAAQDCILGLEFSGREIDSGRRVMGCVPAEALATTVMVNGDIESGDGFVWPVPDKWSLLEASTVPVAYATAYYALIVRGELADGETVLIHAAAGGVGQAAIAICLSKKCRVFCTVSSEQKRAMLKKMFPSLTDECFANSRDTSFEQHVLRHTRGRGADVVLNSLSEEKLQASVRALASHGRFLEIGKYDLANNNPLGMSAFLKNIAFHGILLDALLVDAKSAPLIIKNQRKEVQELMRAGIESGVVRPLHAHVFEAQSEAEKAFRFMANGKHTGKVVLKLRDEERGVAVCKPIDVRVKAACRTQLHPKKAYIITGGLGGFGLELAAWLAARGARHLVLTSRTGPRDTYQRYALRNLNDMGVDVLIYTKPVTGSRASAAKLIKETEAHFKVPVGGVFNLAMVLRDALLENQTVENYELVCGPKIDSVIALDLATRELCGKTCDYFVAFSSVSCGRGNLGQSNYGFANSAMERICESRRAASLHGLAIQWGAIGDVGVVAQSTTGAIANNVNIGGTQPQRIPSCMAVLDKFLSCKHAVCSSLVRAETSGRGGRGQQAGAKGDLLKTVCNILGVRQQTLLPATSLGELGMDSLMGVEIKQTLERDYDVVMPVNDIRALTIEKLRAINSGSSPAAAAAALASQSTGDSSNSSTDFATVSATTSDSTSQQQAHLQSPDAKKLATASQAALARRIATPRLDVPTEPTELLNNIKSGDPVLVLPSTEGTFDIVKPIAKLLSRPLIGINWTQNLASSSQSIEEAAAKVVEIAKTVSSSDQFDLIGYSFGAVLAFEVALQLQKAGKVVKSLSLLDGAPVQMKLASDEAANNIVAANKLSSSQSLSADQRLSAALVTFACLHVQELNASQLFDELSKLKSHSARLAKIKQILVTVNNDNKKQGDNIELAADCYAKRVLMLSRYAPSNKFRGNCLLVKASESLTINSTSSVSFDYNLKDSITGQCQVHEAKGNHQTFVSNELEFIARLLDLKLSPV